MGSHTDCSIIFTEPKAVSFYGSQLSRGSPVHNWNPERIAEMKALSRRIFFLNLQYLVPDIHWTKIKGLVTLYVL